VEHLWWLWWQLSVSLCLFKLTEDCWTSNNLSLPPWTVENIKQL